MTFNWADGRKLVRNLIDLLSQRPGAAVLLGALFLSWPAFFNGFPLLYPDSMTYLGDGPTVARAVFLHRFSQNYGVRSFIYSLGILPFHWNLTAWPVVGLQCLLVAWVLWLVARSIATRKAAARYLILMLLLSLFTSVSWYCSFIMPDILGPLVYLGFYLLVFTRETLTRAERWGLCFLAWWGITSHASHFLLAGSLCLLLAIVAACQRRTFLIRLRSLGEIAAIVALAAAAQMALHGYLYGKPSLNGERPPYLMARIIADGPGRWYLEKHCGQGEWAVCDRFRQLSDNPNDLLWGDESAYQAGSEVDREREVREEMPFVLATLRTYPREQVLKSAANFKDQLLAFGPYGFDPSPWILGEFNHVLPGARADFVRSRQEREALPLDRMDEIQWWTVIASLAVIAVGIVLLWWSRSPGLGVLSLVVAAMVLANSAVTGVLSVVDDRYGCRAIWLVPLLAGLFVLDWLHRREAAGDSGPGRTENNH
jgi:hypothetical protein